MVGGAWGCDEKCSVVIERLHVGRYSSICPAKLCISALAAKERTVDFLQMLVGDIVVPVFCALVEIAVSVSASQCNPGGMRIDFEDIESISDSVNGFSELIELLNRFVAFGANHLLVCNCVFDYFQRHLNLENTLEPVFALAYSTITAAVRKGNGLSNSKGRQQK